MQKRKIDDTGRVVIPKHLVRSLGWGSGTEVVFAERDGTLIVEKAEPYCLCCKKEEDLIPLDKNVYLCRSCLQGFSHLLKKNS